MLIPQMEPWFDEAETQAVYQYMQNGGWVMEFKQTEALEVKLAEFIGSKHCIMTVNGTISLSMALMAFGLKAGDEVIIPDLTMIASPNAAHLLGMKPVMVDIDPQTLCMDLDLAKKALTKKTKALMYVAFNGRSGDMQKVVQFCQEHKLFLLEDSAQALGSYWKGKHLGTFGEIGSFSFSAPKIISTGQGGALVTDDDRLAAKLRNLKNFGRAQGGIDIHDDWGWNFKFTDIQAVIGLEQMKKLEWRVKRKKEIYSLYTKLLKDLSEVEFIGTDLEQTSPWFIDIFVDNPDGLAVYLREKGVGTRKIYPPVHSQKIYQSQHKGVKFPITEKYSSRGLWLPSSSQLTDKQIKIVADSIRSYYNH